MTPATFAMCLCLIGCTHQAELDRQPLTLMTLDGQPKPWQELIARRRFTVMIFVSSECHCLAAHTARLNELAAQYTPRSVQFVAVDSEVGTTAGIAAAEARKYALSFPLVIDSGAQLANTFDALYATYTVIVDTGGNVHYRGGLDSDRMQLHDDAKYYVRNALEDLLAGREPRLREGKTLGCVLRKS